MAIYIGNTEVNEIYYWGEGQSPFTPSSDTIAYFPLEGNITDVTGNTTPSLVRSDLISWNTNAQGKTYMFSDGGNRSGSSNFNWYPSGGLIFTFPSKSLTNITINGWIMNKSFSGSTDWTWTTFGSLCASASAGLGMNESSTYQNRRFATVTYQGSSYDASSSVTPSADTWYNLCVTQRTGNRTLYLDGVQIATVSTAYTGNYVGGGINAQPTDSAGGHYGGSSEFIFEAKERTAAEVLNYFNATKASYGK